MKRRYQLLFLTVILGICIFLFTSFYYQARQEAINHINSEQLLHARMAARGIEDFFNGWTVILSALAESDTIIDMNKSGKEDIKFLFRVANQDRIRAITRMDAAGRIIYTFPFKRDAIGRDISSQRHVREIMRTHQPVISDVFFAVQGYDTVALHVPVFRNKAFKGTIAITVNFQTLAKRFLEDIKIGNTGYAWMISRDGTELYCPVPGHTGKSVFENCKNFPSILAMASDMLKGNQGATTYTFDMIRGDKVEVIKKHAVYMPTKIGSTFWSIVVATSEDEILSSLEGFRNKLIAVIVFLLLCGVLFTYFSLKAWFIIKEEEKRRRTEEALRHSEADYRSVIVNIQDVFYRTDNQGNLIMASPSFLTLLGYESLDECYGRPMAGVFYYYPEKRTQLLSQINQSGKVTDYEVVLKRRDGTPVTVETNSNFYLDDDGNIAGIEGIFRDITERKQTAEILRQSEARFRSMIQSSSDMIFIVDGNAQLTYESPSATLILGYQPGYFIGKSPFMHVHPDDLDQVLKDMDEVFRSVNPGIPTEFRYQKYDGTWIYLEAIGSNQFENPGINGAVLTVRDITARKQAEEAQRILEERLQQADKMEAIGTLAGGIAHDFNNLLMGIQGYASMILMNIDPANPNYERLKNIEQQVQSGADLTSQLLGFARGGRYEVKPSNINEIIEKTSSMFGRTKKEITLQRKLAKDIWNVEVDRGQIEQVFLNMYVNAWQAMPGGGDIYLETRNVVLNDEQALFCSVKPGKHVKITITDTGIGMDEKTKERIFDPFFTTKEMGRGTGLGLATVYGILKGHHGMIHVESVPGQGATFTIYLPATDKEIPKEKAPTGEIITGTETILLVDDEKMVMEVNRELLESMGYKVYVAGSGQEGIALYSEKKDEIDLIILDMIMPGISGSETFDRLRKINSKVKVLLSSGYSLTGEAQTIMDRGSNGFLQKPFRLEELSGKVREVLD